MLLVAITFFPDFSPMNLPSSWTAIVLDFLAAVAFAFEWAAIAFEWAAIAFEWAALAKDSFAIALNAFDPFPNDLKGFLAKTIFCPDPKPFGEQFGEQFNTHTPTLDTW